MLVLHPSARCDVCLDGYHGIKEPLVIPCGHTFCHLCMQSLPKPLCPLCRVEFAPHDVRRVLVDKAMLPPATPALQTADLDAHARRLQASISRVVLNGASMNELLGLLSEASNWLNTQDKDEYLDLRASHTLLYRCTDLRGKLAEEKRRIVDVEQTCSDLNARFDTQLEEELENFRRQLQEERDVAAAKYEELERRSFDEREVLLAAEKTLQEEKEAIKRECDLLKDKCDEVTAECNRLADELDKVKRNPPPPYRPVEPRYYYLHNQNGVKTEPVAVLKDESWDSSNGTMKVQVVGKDNVFHLSPVPATQPIPDVPPSMMAFLPLTDDLDDPIDDDRTHVRSNPISISSASRSKSFKSRSDLHRDRTRSNSSLLTRPDPDAMSISVPRSNLDAHMSSPSTSPNGTGSQYGLRPAEFVSTSVGRVPENMLGLQADPSRVSPPATDLELKEQQKKMVAALHDVLKDPNQGIPIKSPRKSSLSTGSDRDRDRVRAAVPSAMSSTRTPSPVSSTSQSYTSSTMEREYGPAPSKHQHLAVPTPTPISCASHAAAERERARASSVNSQNAPSALPQPPSVSSHHPTTMSSTSLSHVTATRDPPLHAIYGPSPQLRPPHSRRQSNDPSSAALSNISGSISKGKASAMSIAPNVPYASGLTRSMRAMQEAPRVS